jgi:hemerythrin
MKKGFISVREKNSIKYETGPNVILLSDIMMQNGEFSNLAEFPVLQMLYRQGMILPNHPNNKGQNPIIIGARKQVESQLKYIYRGNYGLISKEEIMKTGVKEELAEEMMRMKLKFAFGKISETEELLNFLFVTEEFFEIKNKVMIRRISINKFEIKYENETVLVNLNLKNNERYESAYPLGFQNIERDYFSIIHSGEGDGWDINRPTMSSIVIYQSKIYLIDAGPNLIYSLNALGIGINEIEGIFHTHAHDDHFCGLTSLMRADHKIKYFATPLVRNSVVKKLCALMEFDEEQFDYFFDIYDLETDVWNLIDGMKVKPVFSPHPVETTIFIFSVDDSEKKYTYGHFADIIDLNVLKNMIDEDIKKPGISKKLYNKVIKDYLVKLDLKKLDIGGGIIHGNALDFKNDLTDKILLAHTNLKLTYEQKEIGSGAPFGTTDVFISSYYDYMRELVRKYLKTYFENVPEYEFNRIMNNPIITFNPETILLRKGFKNKYVYLILSGNVERIQSEKKTNNIVAAGSFIGETAGIIHDEIEATYRAVSFVKALQIPRRTYINFIKVNELDSDVQILKEIREFNYNTCILGEMISDPIQNKIASVVKKRIFTSSDKISRDTNGIYIIKCGKIKLMFENEIIEELSCGEFWGESDVLFNIPHLYNVVVNSEIEVYFVPQEILNEIPIVRWKLLECFEKRMRKVLSPKSEKNNWFEWREIYKTNIENMDEQHQKLFKAAENLQSCFTKNESKEKIIEIVDFLVKYTKFHFTEEENYLKNSHYKDYELHCKKHKKLLEEVYNFRKKMGKDDFEISKYVIVFLKEWIINHILTEDRKYGIYQDYK